MTKIIRNEQGQIIGGPTANEVQASIERVHRERPGTNEMICAALSMGIPGLQRRPAQVEQLDGYTRQPDASHASELRTFNQAGMLLVVNAAELIAV